MTRTPKLSARLAAIVEALPLRPDSRVLEIGCGPGAAARAVATRLDTGHILAIDRSAAAIDQAKTAKRPTTSSSPSVSAPSTAATPKAGEQVLQRIDQATTPRARLFVNGDDPFRELPIPRR